MTSVKYAVYVWVSVLIIIRTESAISWRKCYPVVSKIIVKESWVFSTEFLISETKPVEIFNGQCKRLRV